MNSSTYCLSIYDIKITNWWILLAKKKCQTMKRKIMKESFRINSFKCTAYRGYICEERMNEEIKSTSVWVCLCSLCYTYRWHSHSSFFSPPSQQNTWDAIQWFYTQTFFWCVHAKIYACGKLSMVVVNLKSSGNNLAACGWINLYDWRMVTSATPAISPISLRPRLCSDACDAM